MAHELQPLPYALDALEPHIDARTLEIHHGKHHAGYVAKLNDALSGHAHLEKMSLVELIRGLGEVPENIRQTVRDNGGGHFNHTMYWNVMKPGGGGAPQGELADAIKSRFGSLDEFKSRFTQAGATRLGSGWAWLHVKDGKLEVGSTLNHDTPLEHGGRPVLVLDVWEHAYYLQYQNKRADYIKAWWNVVNWEQVARNFQQVK